MINEKYAREYCCEDISLIENYQEALNDNKMWVCHHRLEVQDDKILSELELREMNMYLNRPASELIFMTPYKHKRLHGLNQSTEKRQNISESLKGIKRSEETIQKISESKKGNTYACGRIWINNSKISKMIYPEDLDKYPDFKLGRLKITTK